MPALAVPYAAPTAGQREEWCAPSVLLHCVRLECRVVLCDADWPMTLTAEDHLIRGVSAASSLYGFHAALTEDATPANPKNGA